jgi:hypothetical protein
MDRRTFLRAGILATGGGALLPTVAMVRPVGADVVGPASAGESPYGPLGDTPDENGLILPEGFTSRVIGVAGAKVDGTDYEWPLFPDGAATFDDGEGGWYLAVNSEVSQIHSGEGKGGVSAIHFDADGKAVDAYRILEGSFGNCAGGPTPWGTWLTCEEQSITEDGLVYECDPTGKEEAVAHEAMGRWAHEAAAVDPDGKAVYLTQDHPEGLLYRFTPTKYPDLSKGKLEALVLRGESTSWAEVPDPSGKTAPTRTQVPGATPFNGGEGIWYHDGWIYFTTKGDHSVHGLDVRNDAYRLIWKGDPEGDVAASGLLTHVDNITVDAGSGDLVVAEDGGNMELVLITPEGKASPLVRVVGHGGSEMTGPVFNPARDRLYFSSQRGPSAKALGELLPKIGLLPSDAKIGGVTFEVSGPFRGTGGSGSDGKENPVTTLAKAADGGDGDDDDDDSSSNGVAIGVGAAVLAAAVVGGAVALRNRRAADDPSTDGPGDPEAPTPA